MREEIFQETFLPNVHLCWLKSWKQILENETSEIECLIQFFFNLTHVVFFFSRECKTS